MGEREEAGTCLEALAQASMPWRSKTVRPPTPVGFAGSMRWDRSASYAAAASPGIDNLKSGKAVFFCAEPELARGCVGGWLGQNVLAPLGRTARWWAWGPTPASWPRSPQLRRS